MAQAISAPMELSDLRPRVCTRTKDDAPTSIALAYSASVCQYSEKAIHECTRAHLRLEIDVLAKAFVEQFLVPLRKCQMDL
jgi:hypothetical protein